MLAAALVTPFATGADDAVVVALVLVALVCPVTLGVWRIAAWEEQGCLVVRNLFRTERIRLDTIESLGLSETWWSTDWVYGAVKHSEQKTYIKALIIVFPFSPRGVVAELRALANRHDIPVDESSIRLLARTAAEVQPKQSMEPDR